MILTPTRLYFPTYDTPDFGEDQLMWRVKNLHRIILPAHVFDPIEGKTFLNRSSSKSVGLERALLRYQEATSQTDKMAFLGLLHPEYRDMLQLNGDTEGPAFLNQISNLAPSELLIVVKINGCYAALIRTKGKEVVPLTYSKVGTEFVLTDRAHQVDLDSSALLNDLAHYFSTGVTAPEVLKLK